MFEVQTIAGVWIKLMICRFQFSRSLFSKMRQLILIAIDTERKKTIPEHFLDYLYFFFVLYERQRANMHVRYTSAQYSSRPYIVSPDSNLLSHWICKDRKDKTFSSISINVNAGQHSLFIYRIGEMRSEGGKLIK